jgi:thioredoxin 1
MKEVQAEEIQDVINNTDVAVIDYYAEWCGPCNRLSKVLDKVDVDGTEIVKVNIDENIDHVSEKGIRSVPTIHVYYKGELVKEHVGVVRKNKLVAYMEELLENES